MCKEQYPLKQQKNEENQNQAQSQPEFESKKPKKFIDILTSVFLLVLIACCLFASFFYFLSNKVILGLLLALVALSVLLYSLVRLKDKFKRISLIIMVLLWLIFGLFTLYYYWPVDCSKRCGEISGSVGCVPCEKDHKCKLKSVKRFSMHRGDVFLPLLCEPNINFINLRIFNK